MRCNGVIAGAYDIVFPMVLMLDEQGNMKMLVPIPKKHTIKLMYKKTSTICVIPFFSALTSLTIAK